MGMGIHVILADGEIGAVDRDTLDHMTEKTELPLSADRKGGFR
jgi:hypothetical protein